ncbi:MAG: hypothetical protein BWZ10_02562 [candidate division BRC1 bacterium ADurb.BinA364]|nr:MAG: hypothetical protein BWZ10_02562 [candidate division BRC1 bacterium ADurb.BinA364]
MPGEMLAHVIEHVAHGRLFAAHHALHAMHRADEVRFVNGLLAADADEDVFVLVGDADDFVGHELADG